MKKVLCSFLCLLLSLFFCLSLVSCSRPPKLEDVRDRVIELIEASYEINDLLLGKGLPVYDRNDETYAYLYDPYLSPLHSNLLPTYDVVTPDSPYQTIQSIKDAASRVYSADLLSPLFVTAFDGHVLTGLDGKTVSSDPTFAEDENALYQSVFRENHLTAGKRIFDYSSMKITRPGSKSAFFVTLNSYPESDPSAVSPSRLRFVLQNGSWYLDSLTV